METNSSDSLPVHRAAGIGCSRVRHVSVTGAALGGWAGNVLAHSCAGVPDMGPVLPRYFSSLLKEYSSKEQFFRAAELFARHITKSYHRLYGILSRI